MKRITCLHSRQFSYFILVLLLAGIVFAHPAEAASSVPVRMTDTSIRLLREALRTAGQTQNVLISPDSILTAVVMMENGAAKSTLSEMKTALGNISVDEYTKFLKKLHKRHIGSSLYSYLSANSIWYRKGAISLKKKFRQKMNADFQAEVYGEPFNGGTVKKMNDWASDHTNGKIPSIINRLNASARVVVLNAVYFKGEWANPYFVTKKRNFTRADGTVQKVKMMQGCETSYVRINGATGFIKPYSGTGVAFLALLPPKNMSVSSYLKKLTGADLISGYRNRQEDNIEVYTRIPEFHYEFNISLKSALRRMGIKNAFSAQNADFSKMSSKAVHIDNIIHKTYIQLTKDGTEAAAITTGEVEETAPIPLEEPTIKKVFLNRPFVYAIIDTKTGIPLFLGVVNII